MADIEFLWVGGVVGCIPTSRRDISLLGGRTGYVPPMKEASVMWRRGDEGGEGMSISNYGAISDCGWAGN